MITRDPSSLWSMLFNAWFQTGRIIFVWTESSNLQLTYRMMSNTSTIGIRFVLLIGTGSQCLWHWATSWIVKVKTASQLLPWHLRTAILSREWVTTFETKRKLSKSMPSLQQVAQGGLEDVYAFWFFTIKYQRDYPHWRGSGHHIHGVNNDGT